ncbi:hypothetical protein D3C87_1275770 [compost metagenome]
MIVVGVFAEQQTLLALQFATGLIDMTGQRRAVEVNPVQRAALGVAVVEHAVVRQTHAFELAAGVVTVTQGAPALMLGDQPVLTVVLEGQRVLLAVVDTDQTTETVVLVTDLDAVGQGFDE